MFSTDNKLDEKTKGEYFNIIRRKMNTDQGVVNTGIDLHFSTEAGNLVYHLREQTERDEFYADEPIVSAVSLLPHLTMFRDVENNNASRIFGLTELIAFLEKEYAHEVTKIDNMIKEGVISFDSLSFLFKKGDKVFTWINNEKIAGEVINFKYHQSFFEDCFRVNIKYIKSDGATFKLESDEFDIRAFSKTSKITELAICPLTTEVEEELVERGRLYQKIALGAAYCYNEGNLFWKEYWKTTVIKGIGRVMIDNFNFARVNPDYDRNYGCEVDGGQRNQFTNLRKNAVWL